jgi:uncharacterized membrane protein YkvI
MKDIALKFIHLFDITYLTIIYVTISIIFSMYLNKMIGPFDKNKADKKTTCRLILEIYLNFSIIAITAFLIRNIVSYIPFPLDDIYDYDHTTVHELNGGIIFGFVIFYYQKNLYDKINYLFNERIFNKYDEKLDNAPKSETGYSTL